MQVIIQLKSAKEFFDTLIKLYEKNDPSQKRALKNQHRTLKMEKDDMVSSFLTNISQIRDQLISIGVNVDGDDIVQIVVDGIPSSSETFFFGVNVLENQPIFERLWHNCLQEEGTI